MKQFKSLKNILEDLDLLGAWLRAENLSIVDSENINYSASSIINQISRDSNVYKLQLLLLDENSNQKIHDLILLGEKFPDVEKKHKLLAYSVITKEDKNNSNRKTNLTFVFTEPVDY